MEAHSIYRYSMHPGISQLPVRMRVGLLGRPCLPPFFSCLSLRRLMVVLIMPNTAPHLLLARVACVIPSCHIVQGYVRHNSYIGSQTVTLLGHNNQVLLLFESRLVWSLYPAFRLRGPAGPLRLIDTPPCCFPSPYLLGISLPVPIHPAKTSPRPSTPSLPSFLRQARHRLLFP